jgi:Type II secretory pathway, component PulJ
MHARINNKGMSILELIISMTISAIVVFMIITFISAAFRVFRKTNDDVNLQMEAQTAMNQIVNIAMEAKEISEPYSIGNIARYKIDHLNVTGNSDYALIYDGNQQKLYLVTLSAASTDEYKTVIYSEKDNLLAEYVAEFLVKDAQAGKDSTKRIAIKLQLGSNDFLSTQTVCLRNYS